MEPGPRWDPHHHSQNTPHSCSSLQTFSFYRKKHAQGSVCHEADLARRGTQAPILITPCQHWWLSLSELPTCFQGHRQVNSTATYPLEPTSLPNKAT